MFSLSKTLPTLAAALLATSMAVPAIAQDQPGEGDHPPQRLIFFALSAEAANLEGVRREDPHDLGRLFVVRHE